MSAAIGEKHDVAIIGGGPGGAATALYLLNAGIKPVLIEKDTFPRYHVGESLTGECGGSLRKLGLADAMRNEGYPIKHALNVWGPGGRKDFSVEVQDRDDQNRLKPSTTWQVKRSRFDQILLDTAISRGAEFVLGTAVDPLMEGDRVSGVRLRSSHGPGRDVRADVIVDASGQANFLANRGLTGAKEPGPGDKEIAVFSQLSGFVTDSGSGTEQKPGNTLCFYREKRHWAWCIPLDNQVVSVGVVTPSGYFASRKPPKTDFLRQELESLNPELSRRITNLSFIEEVRAASSFSYICRRFTGKGFLCVGDSHRFMDPIFSFGLHFAVKEAEFASHAILRYLNGETRDLDNPFAEYEALVDAGQALIQEMVDCFWDFPQAFQKFVKQDHRDEMIDLFSGRVYGKSVEESVATMRRVLSKTKPDPPKAISVAGGAALEPAIELPKAGKTKLKVEGISMAFQRDGDAIDVLSNISLEAREGEFMCILGPSGCGKSTLLNIVAGFLKPTAGRVTIDGQPVADPDPRRIFVFQERGVFPWLTVEGNIGFGLSRLSAEERQQRVAHYVKLVGLEGFEKAYPRQLSGGMKQRVEVARALAVNPDMLFLDEPFGALDSITRLIMRGELLRIWNAERKTILFVTHDIEESVQLADRVIVMSARPAAIRRIVDIDIPHPRDISSPRYLELRDGIFKEIGLAHKI